ncbi:MAG: YveK family protein [Aristaeellaceae bacterium]
MKEEKVRQNRRSNAGEVLDLLGYFQYLVKHILIIIGVTAAVFAGAAVYVFALATPVYEASAQLYVVNSQDSVVNLTDLQIGSYLASDYQWIFKTWEVNQQVIENLNLPYTVADMKKMLKVTNPSNTRILVLTFSSESAAEAAAVANEYALVASQYISDYMLTTKPSIISVALEPLSPARPQKLLIIAVSTLLALLACLWCMFVAYLYSDKIKTAEDLKRYMGSEPLAVIPLDKPQSAGRR